MKKAIILLLLLTSLSLTQLVQAADEGSAQAEVLDSAISSTIAQDVSFGSFYVDPTKFAQNSNTAAIVMPPNGSAIVSEAINHRGGSQHGIIDITAAPNATLTISAGEGVAIKLTNSGTNDALEYTPQFAGASSDRNGLFKVQYPTNSQGKLRVYILGLLAVKDKVPSPGIYTGQFNIDISH